MTETDIIPHEAKCNIAERVCFEVLRLEYGALKMSLVSVLCIHLGRRGGGGEVLGVATSLSPLPRQHAGGGMAEKGVEAVCLQINK